MAVHLQGQGRSLRSLDMIWLPCPDYSENMKVLTDEHLEETRRDLVKLAKKYAGKDSRLDETGGRWHDLFYEAMDSFYTFGLFTCSESRARGGCVTKWELRAWQKRWEEYHKPKRMIIHPDWPSSFITSMRTRLVQLDRDHYGPKFDIRPPKKKVEIQWPTSQ